MLRTVRHILSFHAAALRSGRACRSRAASIVVPLLGAAVMNLTSCKTAQEASDEEAGIMLGQARELLADGHFNAARDTIYSLRRLYPAALETRRAAILTLDSVELMQTRDSLQRYETALQAAREGFQRLQPRVDGRTNDLYYQQQRRVFEMEQHFDELCAKAKFYVRKIDIDLREL